MAMSLRRNPMEHRCRAARIAALLCALAGAAAVSAQETSQGTIIVDIANVRDGAGTQHNVVGQMKKSEGVIITGQQGSWYQVRSADGKLTGFVQFRLVRPSGTAMVKNREI